MINAHITSYLNHAIARGRLAHSLLFTGASGAGRSEMALWLAKRLNCNEEKACGACEACKRIERGTYPDVIFVFPEIEDPAFAGERKASGRQPKQVISIDQVRAIERQMSLAPYEGRSRLVIFNPADRMEAEGMNSLLKLLEEPPKYTYIILITSHPQALIPTVRSRVQTFIFRDAPAAVIQKFLMEKHSIAESEAHWLSFLALGSVKDADKYDISRMAAKRKICVDTLLSFRAPDAPIRITDFAEIMGKSQSGESAYFHREEARLALSILESILRDGLILKFASDTTSFICNADIASNIREISAYFSEDALLQGIALIEDSRRALDGNVDKTLVLERTLFSLKASSTYQTGISS